MRGFLLGGFDGVVEEHGDGHGAYAAGDGGDERGSGAGRAVGDVADEAAVGAAVDADVGHGRALGDPVAADQLGFAHGGDDHVGAAYFAGQVAGARMAGHD